MKKVLLIFVGIILLVSVPILVFFVGQRQELRNKAAPATTLSIQPNTSSIAVGETVIWKILINTAENKVATVKVSLIFDQTKFEAQSITNGILAPKILTQGTVGAGTATITVAAESTTKPIIGQGEIAILRLKALSGSSTPVAVQFAPDTFVAGIGETTVNVLTSSQPGSVTITGSSDLAAAPTTSANPTPIVSSPTPNPTIKPLENLVAQPASSSALTLTVDTEATRGGKPRIKGTAPAGATVTIVIHAASPQTQVVTADTEGKWETTPTIALKTGTYTIVITALHPTAGTTETVSSSFTIGGGIGGADITEATGEGLPESGSPETTLILIFIGSLMMVFGSITLAKKYI
jgi:hypothetical protein